MSAKRVHNRYFIYIAFSLLLFVPPTVSFRKTKIIRNDYPRIAVDYFGRPLITGDEYEEAIIRAEREREKRQNTPQDLEEVTPHTAQLAAAETLPNLPTTLAPSSEPSTSEPENVTVPSTSPPGGTSESPSTGPSSSHSPSTTTTTTTEATTPSTTTTTEEPEPEIPLGEGKSTKGYFCLCDYQVKVCDMNCCCDPDCSAEEREKLFKRCDDDSRLFHPSSKRSKEESCVKSYYMFRNNTLHGVDRSDKGMFCVVKENVHQVKEFSRTDMARLASRISHGKIDTRPKYTWDTLHDDKKIAINYNAPYKYGSAIWAMRPDKENKEDSKEPVMFRLPAPLLTDTCSVLEPVKYLQESESRCTRPLHDIISQCDHLKELNVNHFIKDQLIIGNPSTFNKEENWTDSGSDREEIIPARWCHNSMDNCKTISLEYDLSGSGENVDFPAPALGGGMWDALHVAASKCTNVLSQLNLTFIHEGIQGVKKVLARALLIDLPSGQKEIVQEFRTEFIWSNARKSGGDGSSNDTDSNSMESLLQHMKLPRSGNPGYMVGKPLILGRKVVIETPKNESEGKSKFAMYVTPDLSKWLRIQGSGDCPLTEKQIKENARHTVIFGYEHVASCKLPLEHFRDCEQLQKHIQAVIYGYVGDVPPTSPLYIAAFGSPDAFPSDWVPMKYVSLLQSSSSSISDGCSAIITAVHITVSFAYVGPVDAPQAKITGIFYETEDSTLSIPDASDEVPSDITVTTTVSFLDVTEKPTTRVASFPVLSVKLPKDFFYPFSSTTSGPSSGAKKISLNDLLLPSLASLILYGGTFIL